VRDAKCVSPETPCSIRLLYKHIPMNPIKNPNPSARSSGRPICPSPVQTATRDEEVDDNPPGAETSAGRWDDAADGAEFHVSVADTMALAVL
jgi:hypothetical protein